MRKSKFLLVILALVCLMLPAKAMAQNVQGFSFESFDTDYYLNIDSEKVSTLTVKETLTALFPDSDQNHGILRAIPKTYNDHTLSLNNIQVTDETGNSYPYTSSDENGNKVLKIGDANSYVHGRKVYKINYQLQDVNNYFSDHDEFFWDINGDQFQQTFATVTTKVHVPRQLANALQNRQVCYTGIARATTKNCVINRENKEDETVITSSATDIGPRQTLSVVLGFKSGTFQKSSAVKNEERNQKLAGIVALIFLIVPPVFVGSFMFKRWRQFGNDPKGRGIIIPEYDPPKGFDVLNSDYLLSQKLSSRAISAALIDAAIRGYIAIHEIPKSGLFGNKDYKLTVVKTPDAQIPQHFLGILEAIFGVNLLPGETVKVSEFKKDSSKRKIIYDEIQSAGRAIAENLTSSGYFIKNPKKVKNGYQTWAGVLLFLGSAVFFIAGLLAGNFSFGVLPVIAVGIALLVSALIVFVFSFIMPARTKKGVETNDYLLGLKSYIKLAEADRLKFLQSPQGAEKLPVADKFNPKTNEAKVKLFEKLLPYAMLFGLEKDWAKQFEGIYSASPGWYQGDYSTFSAVYLASSLGDFNSTAGTGFASPSSSSGSGFSGGGAGGGGGGGGGGGW